MEDAAQKAPQSWSPRPPQPPKESLARRYKVVWRVLLISNLTLGAYMFARARKKDTAVGHGKAESKLPPPPVETTETAALKPEEPVLLPPVIKPVKFREPIPEDRQRELFKWILGEKRKVKPNDWEDKRQIDEEKALLKQFICAESIPRI
ncbi:hypothetical protein NMG60_11021984 [Bertholletia excelsa]